MKKKMKPTKNSQEFQSVKAERLISRKKPATQKKPRGIKSPGARSGLKKGAGG